MFRSFLDHHQGAEFLLAKVILLILSKHVGVILIVFKCLMWNLFKCNCWLINEVILGNARCNNKVYSQAFLAVPPLSQILSVRTAHSVQGLGYGADNGGSSSIPASDKRFSPLHNPNQI